MQIGALTALNEPSPQNMIAQSQSGTGKTAAFVLTMLSRVDYSKNVPQVRWVCCLLVPFSLKSNVRHYV